MDIEFLCVLNAPHAMEHFNFFKGSLDKWSKGLINPVFKLFDEHGSVGLNSGSHSHALGLQHLIDKVDTEWFCTMDYDIAILSPWEELVLSSIDKGNLAIGTTYGYPKKYTSFPTLFFSFWQTKYWREAKVDLSLDAKIDADLPAYPKHNLHRDIGVQIPTAYHGQKHEGWEKKEVTTPRQDIWFKNDQSIVSHMGKGSHRGPDHPRTIEWRDSVTTK